MRVKLENHLAELRRGGGIRIWSPQHVAAGIDRKRETEAHLAVAHIILLLISADYLASEYLHDVEVEAALARARTGSAQVIPVLLRAYDLKSTAFEGLSPLPPNGEPECVAARPGRAAMYEGDDGWAETAPVGTHPKGASPFGVDDVAGNVWEWVAGPYLPGSSRHILRGGGWHDNDSNQVRAAKRNALDGSFHDANAGFRCARSPNF